MLDYNPEESAITKPFQLQALLGCTSTSFVFMLGPLQLDPCVSSIGKPSKQNVLCIALCGCDIKARLHVQPKFGS